MSDDTEGRITVDIDAHDLQHLISHGRATITKEVGPIDVKIRCDPQIVHRIDMIEKREGDRETIAEVEG